MLGWHISVYRQAGGGLVPGTPTAERAECIAVWQAGIGGLAWIDDLVAGEQAVHLGGDGYPYWYTAQAQQMIPRIIEHPLEARAVWVYGPQDIITEGWQGRTTIDRDAVDKCGPTEWLLVEVFDES